MGSIPKAKLAALSALVFSGAIGCTAPVVAGLDEPEANRVLVALDRASVDATKETDPSGEGKFRVVVAKDDVPRALGALREEELPRARSQGVLDAIGKGSLVPSAAAEQAQIAAGLAGDLQRTLEGLDGVLRARVHLQVPAPEPFSRYAKVGRATASVLVEHRGAAPPVDKDQIARLVAGGVTGLAAQDVAVVLVARAASPRAGVEAGTGQDSGLAHVGPIAVARGSVRSLQLALVALVSLVAVLAAVTLFLYARLRRVRAELSQPASRAGGGA